MITNLIYVLLNWWHQAINWTNVCLSSKVFYGIHLGMISLELLKNSQKVLLNLVCNMCSVIKFREKIITTSASSSLVNQVSSLLSGCKNPQNVKLTLIYLCCNLPTPEEVGPPAWGGHRTTMLVALYIYILFQVKSLWNFVPFLIHWIPMIYMLSSFFDI